MNGREVFNVWAPKGIVWSAWVRPVPFVFIDRSERKAALSNLIIPEINYLKVLEKNAALILDLPGNDAVEEGVELAKLGYRPVPLYNGTTEQEGASALVDNKDIEMALLIGAKDLENSNLAADAPPAFLLDSNRAFGYKMNASVFDNSYDMYPQDFPSAEFLIKHNINKIIVRSDKIRKDLNAILFNFQKKKIKIYFTDGFDEPQEIIIKKPPKKLI